MSIDKSMCAVASFSNVYKLTKHLDPLCQLMESESADEGTPSANTGLFMYKSHSWNTLPEFLNCTQHNLFCRFKMYNNNRKF